jgi:radical SAM protein with 4Fe4S-binding SPASM domain
VPRQKHLASEELTFDEIATIFSRLNTLAGLSISLAGGEPFLRADLGDIVRLLTNRGHPVYITTNGSLPERVEKMAQSLSAPHLVSLAVSIDGLGESHDAIRRIQGAFEKGMRTIEVAQEAGLAIQVVTVVHSGNVMQLPEIERYFRERGIPQVFNPLSSFPQAGEWYEEGFRYLYTEDEVARIVPFMNGHPTDVAYVVSCGRLQIRGRNCHAGETSVYIDPQGVVYPCLTIKEALSDERYRIGGLRDFDLNFDALWTSPEAWRVRMLVKKCVGCYSGCEVSREVDHHGWSVVVPPEELARYVPIPSRLWVGEPSASPFLPSGWHQAEGDHRWTKQRALAYLARQGSRLYLKALCSHPDLVQRPVEARITVDGKEVGRLRFQSSDANKFREHRFALPCGDGIAQITIEVDRTWQPSQALGSRDTRELGLAVQELRIE